MGSSISTSTLSVPSFKVAEKRFTEDELKAFRKGFSRLCSMDPSRQDNAVGFDVFQSVLLLDFPDLPQGLVQRLFSVLDTDKSHSINYEKLLCGLCAMSRGSLNERLNLLLAVYDVDGTGDLERARLEKIALTLSDPRSSQEDQVSSQALISSVFQLVGKDVVPASSFQGAKVQRVIATYLHAPLLSWPVMVGQSLLEPLFELDDGLAPLSPTTMYYTSPSRAPLNPYGLKASPHNEAFLSDAITPTRTREQIEEGREFLAASDFDGSDELNEGDSWFVLELAWFEHWKAYTGCEELESGGIPDKPGPICNSCLLRNDPTEAAWTYIGLDGTKEAFQSIRPDAFIDEDYVVLNEMEWRVLYGRYGADVVLRREVVISVEGEPVLELHPKPLNVRCVALCASPVDSREGGIGNMQPDTTLATLSSTKIGERLVQSNETSIQALRETATGNDVFQEPQHIVVSVRMSLEEMARHVICQSFIDPRGRTTSSFGQAQWDADLLFSDRARIWSVQKSLEGDMSDSSPSLRRRDIVNVQLLRDHKATVEEGELEDGQTILLELLSSEGVWPLENATTLSSMETDFHKGVFLGVEQEKSEFREGQPQLLGGARRRNDQRNNIFRLSQKDVNGTTLDPSFSKLKDTAPTVRTIAKTGTLAGTGFLNLGNTCFMNASLQCILSTRLFMQYFEQGSFVMDINKTNKFGTKGHLVDAFAELVRMYAASNKGRPINPVRFKREIGKWDRRFAGFDQQDASELLSAVLEGLSEDLNKIKAKAYTELKDSEGRADDVVAREWWENHLRRELSIITALFTGQFKSVVECEVCGFQSARFEPFTYLSLPLPDSPLRSIIVNVIFSDGKRPPLVCAVRVDKDSTHGAIKQAICDLGAAESEEVTSAMNNVEKRVKVTLNPARMVLAFVFDRQIQSIIPDDRPLHMLKDKESLFAFEIPEVNYAETEVFAGPFCSVRYSDADLALANIGPEDISEGVCEPLNAERQKEDRGMKDSKSANPTHLSANSKGSQKVVRDVRLAKHVSMKKGKSSKTIARGIFPGAFVTYGVGNKAEEGDEEPCALVVERRPKNMWAIKVPLGEFSHRYRTLAVPEETLEAVEVDPILIKVEQRQWHRQMCYFLNPYRLTPVGEPIVLLLETNRVTGAALYKLLSDQVGVSPRVPLAGEELLPDDLDSSKKIMKFFGFKLIVLSQTGGTCYRCPWYKSCKGCPILPNGDLISLQNLEPGSSIAMDWGMASTTKHQRLALSFELADTHESVEKVQQEENREMPLSDLIENFSSSERLEGMNQVHCARCKSHQDHSKTIKLWRTPPVLIVHLKRFQHSSWRRKKMTNLVRFPMNDLDFSPYIAESMPDRPSMRLPPKKPKGEEKETPNEDRPPTGKKSAPKPARRTTKMLKKEREKEEAAAFEAQHLAEVQKLMDSDYVGLRAFGGHKHGDVPPMYDLYGVVNHAGSLQGGHYIASVKRDQSHWQKFDDRSVSMINSKSVVSSQAYLLFYVRKDVQEADVSDVFPTKDVPLKEVRHRLQEVHPPLKAVVAERLQDRCSIM